MVVVSSSETGSSTSTFTDSSGIISSPNYPEPYPHYNEKYYEIIAPSFRTIKLQFLKFDVFDSWDYQTCGWENYLRVRVLFQIPLYGLLHSIALFH